tara:strand:+ start:104 stop:481 length:378 start_codon:yes stop_codon:yes gene_type:complete
VAPGEKSGIEYVAHNSLAIYDESDAAWEDAPHFVDAVGFAKCPVSITDKGERQVVMLGETTMTFSRICTDTDNGGTGFYEIGVVIAECTGFSRASRREVAWVKKQHDCAVFQDLVQLKRDAIVRL